MKPEGSKAQKILGQAHPILDKEERELAGSLGEIEDQRSIYPQGLEVLHILTGSFLSSETAVLSPSTKSHRLQHSP